MATNLIRATGNTINRALHTHNMASPSYMTRERLAEVIKSSPDSVAVIDVRDEDHIGGHIRGSQHVPSSTLDYKIPELARKLKDKPVVVFHCALSKQRGPFAAHRYVGDRERLLQVGEGAEQMERGKDKSGSAERSEELKVSGTESSEQNGGSKAQEIYVLQGGFTKWQEVYGTDPELTEDYAADLWQF